MEMYSFNKKCWSSKQLNSSELNICENEMAREVSRALC